MLVVPVHGIDKQNKHEQILDVSPVANPSFSPQATTPTMFSLSFLKPWSEDQFFQIPKPGFEDVFHY